jgi:Tfp pilus assembly protein PilO
MNKNRSPQIFFILAALTLAAGTGATIFQWQEIGDKWDSIAELKKNVRDPKDIAAEFEETSNKVITSKAELEHLEKSVPAFAYVPTMLKELEAYGKQNGIEVLGIRPIPKAESKDKNGKKKKAPYEEIAIEVKGRGGYKAVQSFVVALAKFPKIVSARAVSLQPKELPGAPPGTKTLDVTIEIRAFLFPPAEEPNSADAAVTAPTTTSSGPNSEAPNAGAAAQTPEPAAKEATKEPAKAQPATTGAATKVAVATRRNSLQGSRKSSTPRSFAKRRARR